MTYVARTHRRPECLDPIRIAAANFVPREKQKTRTTTAEIAKRIGRRRNEVTKDLSALQKGKIDGLGLEYLFRLVEALDHDVVVTFVPRTRSAVAA